MHSGLHVRAHGHWHGALQHPDMQRHTHTVAVSLSIRSVLNNSVSGKYTRLLGVCSALAWGPASALKAWCHCQPSPPVPFLALFIGWTCLLDPLPLTSFNCLKLALMVHLMLNWLQNSWCVYSTKHVSPKIKISLNSMKGCRALKSLFQQFVVQTHIFLSVASTFISPNFSPHSSSLFQSFLPLLSSAGLPAVLLIHRSLSQM